MKIKRFKEVFEDAPANATGVAVATNEPIVRKKKKKEDSSGREIGTPELLKRYKEDTPGQENAITESVKIKNALKKVKGLSKKQIEFMLTLPTPVLTTMINQLSTLVAGDDEHPPHVKDKEKEKKKVVLKGSLSSVNEARLIMDGKLVSTVENVLDVIVKKLKAEMGKKYRANAKDGMAFISSIAKMVGMVVTDKKQGKNRLFLKQGDELEEGLWDNIRKKRARGEKMRKKGEKGAPTQDQIQRAQEDKEEQDKDVKDKEGTQPKKYYKGLDKKTKEKRDAHFKKGLTGPAPGDEDEDGEPTKTKKSVHTKKFDKMFGKN
jgi:hypothetical protein